MYGEPVCEDCEGDVEDNGVHCKIDTGNFKVMIISIALATVVAGLLVVGVGLLLWYRKCCRPKDEEDYEVIN